MARGPPKPKTLGDRIKATRVARGWSQVDLAAAIGVANTEVSDWERDRHEPLAGRAAKIAEEMGVTLDFLLYGNSPKSLQSKLDNAPTDIRAIATNSEAWPYIRALGIFLRSEKAPMDAYRYMGKFLYRLQKGLDRRR